MRGLCVSRTRALFGFCHDSSHLQLRHMTGGCTSRSLARLGTSLPPPLQLADTASCAPRVAFAAADDDDDGYSSRPEVGSTYSWISAFTSPPAAALDPPSLHGRSSGPMRHSNSLRQARTRIDPYNASLSSSERPPMAPFSANSSQGQEERRATVEETAEELAMLVLNCQPPHSRTSSWSSASSSSSSTFSDGLSIDPASLVIQHARATQPVSAAQPISVDQPTSTTATTLSKNAAKKKRMSDAQSW